MSASSSTQIRKMYNELPKVAQTKHVYKAMKRTYKKSGYPPLMNFVLACRGRKTIENLEQILS